MVFFNRNLVTFVGSLVFMIHLTWKLSTVTLVGIPVLTMISHIFGNNQKVHSKNNSYVQYKYWYDVDSTWFLGYKYSSQNLLKYLMSHDAVSLSPNHIEEWDWEWEAHLSNFFENLVYLSSLRIWQRRGRSPMPRLTVSQRSVSPPWGQSAASLTRRPKE